MQLLSSLFVVYFTLTFIDRFIRSLRQKLISKFHPVSHVIAVIPVWNETRLVLKLLLYELTPVLEEVRDILCEKLQLMNLFATLVYFLRAWFTFDRFPVTTEASQA